MAISDARVIEGIEDGRIVIDPFNDLNLNTSSYDIRLGEFFFREQKPELDDDVFNMYDEEHVKRVWGEFQTAPAAHSVLSKRFFERPQKNRIIRPEDKVILIKPGETILAHTEEFIGGRVDLTTMMKARSSTGRCFITVCKCAGWGDVGYINRWTMEITNVSQHYKIPMLVGGRIGQIVFDHTGPIRDLKKDYSASGNYQSSADIEEIKRTWHPDSMLPRMRP